MTTAKTTAAVPGLADYGDWTVEDAEKDEAVLAEGGAAWMKLAVGRNIVRIVPPQPGKSPFLIYHQHFINRPDGTRVSFACPNREAKLKCPACEHADKLFNSGNKIDKDAAKPFWPRKRILVNVINRADPDAGPRILGIPKTVYEDIINIRKNPDAGGNPVHPINGFDLCIERKGTGQFDTEYTVIPSRKNSPLGPTTEVMNQWITEQNDLAPHAKLLTAQEIISKLANDDGPAVPPRGALAGKTAPQGSDLEDFAPTDDDDLNF